MPSYSVSKYVDTDTTRAAAKDRAVGAVAPRRSGGERAKLFDDGPAVISIFLRVVVASHLFPSDARAVQLRTRERRDGDE